VHPITSVVILDDRSDADKFRSIEIAAVQASTRPQRAPRRIYHPALRRFLPSYADGIADPGSEASEMPPCGSTRRHHVGRASTHLAPLCFGPSRPFLDFGPFVGPASRPMPIHLRRRHVPLSLATRQPLVFSGSVRAQFPPPAHAGPSSSPPRVAVVGHPTTSCLLRQCARSVITTVYGSFSVSAQKMELLKDLMGNA
jgi:hypothetical protein